MKVIVNKLSYNLYYKIAFIISILIVCCILVLSASNSWLTHQVVTLTQHNPLTEVKHVNTLIQKVWITALSLGQSSEIEDNIQTEIANFEANIKQIENQKNLILLTELSASGDEIKSRWISSLDQVITNVLKPFLGSIKQHQHWSIDEPAIALLNQYRADTDIFEEQIKNTERTSLIHQAEAFSQVKTLTIISVLFSLIFILIFYYLIKKFFRRYLTIINAINNYHEPIGVTDCHNQFLYANKAMTGLYNTNMTDAFVQTKNGNPSLQCPNKMCNLCSQLSCSPDGHNSISVCYDDTTSAVIGKLKHYMFINSVFKESNRKVYRTIVASDVTDLTHSRNLSRKNQEKLQSILDISGEGQWEWDILNNKICLDNKCREIIGLGRSEISYDDYENLVFDGDKAEVIANFRTLLEQDSHFDMKYRILRPDGSIIWVWDRCIAVSRDKQGHAQHIVGITQDITAVKADQDKVHSLAFYDTLTHLPNRTLLNERLNQVIKESLRNNCYSALLFLDLNRFKVLNDTYGHQIGDQLLVEVAYRLKACLRNEDTVARFSSDNFVIILSQLDPCISGATSKTNVVTDKIRDSITQPVQLNLGEEQLDVNYMITTSIGGVIFNNSEQDSHNLLKLADVALQRVKLSGYNDCILLEPDMQQQLNHESGLQKELRNAVTLNHMAIHLQPKYNIYQEIVGAEALLRWTSPIYGSVPPSTFIPLAEETYLIVLLGNWVLKQACQLLELWQKDPALFHLQISINISAKQIWQKDFVSSFSQIIKEHEFDPSKLTLEITESILLRDVKETIGKLSELKALGCLISLDDFGTGYSSLSYLKNLPIDELKIDRSFVMDLTANNSDLIMVKSIIDLGENFRVKVVSEGVEDKTQFEQLVEFGCPQYQGYYFSKPLPLSGFLDKVIYSSTK